MFRKCLMEVKEMQVVLNDVLEKIAISTDEEFKKVKEAVKKRERKEKQKTKYKPDPNIEWLKENRDDYAGNYVALKGGDLIVFGRTIKEADTKAKQKGFDKAFLHYIPAKDEIVWGGW